MLPTARQFLKEAAGRYVALDGRVWRTLARLLFHPGYLTLEYFAGRRRRYVRPARLFLVLSLLMFAALRLSVEVRGIGAERVIQIDAKPTTPPADVDATRAPATISGPMIMLPGISLGFDDQANVVTEGLSGPLAGEVKKRIERFNSLAPNDKAEQLYLGVMRYGPYAVFALLPAFACLMWLAYLGRHAPYPGRPRRYAEHLVFAAHSHAFFFLTVTLLAWIPSALAVGLLVGWVLLYGAWSMKVVYRGRWIGLLARAWIVGVAYFVLFCFATVGLVLTSAILR